VHHLCLGAPSLLGALDAARLVTTLGLVDGRQARHVLASFLAAGGLAPTSTFAGASVASLHRDGSPLAPLTGSSARV